MAIIEHCRIRQKAKTIYRVKNFKSWETLFICESTCKECGKPFFNTIGFDLWGKREPESGTFVVDKKLYYAYQDLIRQGKAVKIDPSLMNMRNTKASAAGVGKWTLLAKLPADRVYKKILDRPHFSQFTVIGKLKVKIK